jgi:hypothetical protein
MLKSSRKPPCNSKSPCPVAYDVMCPEDARPGTSLHCLREVTRNTELAVVVRPKEEVREFPERERDDKTTDPK